MHFFGIVYRVIRQGSSVVEQETHKLLVAGSIPAPATINTYNMKPTPPKLEISGLQLASEKDLMPEATLENVRLIDVDVTGLDAKNLSFDESILQKVTFTQAQLEKLSLIDAKLQESEFSAVRCPESSFIRTTCSNSRMTGINLSNSTLKDVVFENCKLDLANFRFAKLTRVSFINCSLSEVDFQGAELSDVIFQKSQLEKVDFTGSKIKSVDLRSSELINIRSWQSLKGATIDSAQLVAVAPQLAAQLGLTISD